MKTGIAGEVYRGPTQPVCVVSDPCEETFAATFILYSGDVELLRFQTAADGKFLLEVSPGDYLIVPGEDAPILYPQGQGRSVTVPQGSVVTVRLDFDTGIL